MDTSVPSLYGQPLFVKVSLQYRLTAIVVDPQVKALNGKKYDVVFVGTDDGRVIKFTNSRAPDVLDVDTAVITDTQALPHGTRISELRISKSTNSLIVLGQGRIVSIPLFHCKEMTRCRDCLALQDPYCMWHDTNHECASIYDNQNAKDIFIQDLAGKLNAQMCKKYYTDENFVEQPPIVIQTPSHSTLTGVGRTAINLDNNELTNEIIRFHQLDGECFLNFAFLVILNNMFFSVDSLEPVPREISDPTVNQVQTNTASVAFWALIVLLAAIVGVIFGIIMSRRCSKNDPFPSEHHRNQLSW